MNDLESDLEAVLFTRSSRGVQLTAQGLYLQQEAPSIIDVAQKLIDRMNSAKEQVAYSIRIGSSLLQPHQDVWPYVQVANYYADDIFNISIVPLTDSERDGNDVFAHLGNDIDVLFTSPAPSWDDRCSSFLLTQASYCILVPIGNLLAQHYRISPHQLAGQRIMIASEGTTESLDKIRTELRAIPGVVLVESPKSYDIAAVDECAHSNTLLVSFSHWAEIHPEMSSVEIEGRNYTSPRCFVYAKEPSDSVRRFISAFEKARAHGAFRRER